eukprot:9059764-Karenia_brevis.AAC.1
MQWQIPWTGHTHLPVPENWSPSAGLGPPPLTHKRTLVLHFQLWWTPKVCLCARENWCSSSTLMPMLQEYQRRMAVHGMLWQTHSLYMPALATSVNSLVRWR